MGEDAGKLRETSGPTGRPVTSPAVVVNGQPPLRPNTSPACGGADSRVLHVPRNVAIRSRFLMQRTSCGPRRVPLPLELVPVVRRVEHDTAGEARTARSRCLHTTHFIGEKSQMVPVEMVSTQPLSKRPISSRIGSLPAAEKEATRLELPVLTPELRTDLKQKLDSLVSVCRTDFKAHPRSTRFFLRELWELCQLLKVPVSSRPYRRRLADGLYQFVTNIPNFLPADLAPSSAELAEDSFLTMTVMLALGSIPWEFRFNRVLYRLCNCSSAFGSHRCLLPTGGIRSSEFVAPSRPTPRGVRSMEGEAAPAPSPHQGKLDALQRQEQHLPTRLLDVSAALRVRFLEFVQQVPVFLEDLLKSTVEKPLAEQVAHQKLLWERWANVVFAEISTFDKSYSQFERLYMMIVKQLIETTLEPIHSMADTSSALMNASGDPFREVQAAALCQRLGLLKQTVDFGGSNQVLNFDPGLLGKAQRVLHMETYAEVRDMARVLLKNFEALCKVLLHLNDDQVKMELKENTELTGAILRLEQVWADCQFILHQGCLDFIEILEREVLPQLSPQLKWLIHVALETESPAGKASTNADHTELQNARVALYQTVPMMVYVDELWKDSNPDGPSRKVRFMELCCPQDDRHHTLRRDFGKFDEKRFNEFRSFIIAENEKNRSGGSRQTDFFRLVYRQLKAVSAFPIQENLSAAILAASNAQAALKQSNLSDRDLADALREQELLEGGARWLCLMLKVQAVAPHLFPSRKPGSENQIQKERGSRLMSRGRRASVAKQSSSGRRSSISGLDLVVESKE